MEWKNTKWVRGKFFEISAIILGILAIVVLFGFAIQQGNAMLALTGCGITNISCVLFRSTLLVCIILAGGYILFLLIAFTLDLVIKTQLGIPNILSWFRTPKSVNLNLSVGSVYANEHTLKFSSKEWRYPFQYMALIAVAKFDHGREAGGLEWRKLKTAAPLVMRGFKRFTCLELNFIKVDADKNIFWIDSKDRFHLDLHKFPSGMYPFIVDIGYSFLPKRISDANDVEFPFMKSYLVNVEYKGGSEIVIEVKVARWR